MSCNNLKIKEKAQIMSHFVGDDRIADLGFARGDFGGDDYVLLMMSERMGYDIVCVSYDDSDSPDSAIEKLEREVAERGKRYE